MYIMLKYNLIKFNIKKETNSNILYTLYYTLINKTSIIIKNELLNYYIVKYQ